jgi:hypothetical protein
VFFPFLYFSGGISMTTTTKTALTIPSKDQKQASELRDGLRIIAWKDWKSANKKSDLNVLELYEQFAELWKEHDIHSKPLAGVLEFIKSLGYERSEILKIRSEYYQARQEYKERNSQSSSYEPAF